MPCAVAIDEKTTVFGSKLISVYLSNHGTQYPGHSGLVVLFEGQHGQPIAILEASSITQIRTAAASGLATKYLAPSDDKKPLVCGILGAGVQAESHIEAMISVRKIEKVLIWNRTFDKAEALAKQTQAKYKIQAIALKSVKEVVTQSDILCTVTASKQPIVEGKWIKPGTHINAVGACTPMGRELDSETVKKSKLFTDSKVSLFAEAGDFLIPKKEGTITEDHFKGEVGDLVTGKIQGRTSPNDITLFKSLGIAVEDVVCAYDIYTQAKKSNVGTEINNFFGAHSNL
eukprot:TRINITY_DN5709_c0_g1_i1.p1 TRINITY_DN5709_c0_g1~~TRINITY_DN5709_c0_g1_i1.p1  ORF type:complete len:287 (+),score=62.12 TRINITY_DN5709_c0_g1_i1:48-908(+)